MDARTYLMQYEDADMKVRRLEAEYQKEREMIDAVRSSAKFDEVSVKKQNQKAQEEKIIRLAYKAEKLKEAKIEAIEKRQEIMETINKVEGRSGEVLYNKYIRLMSWPEVAALMHYSWGGIHKLKRKGWAQVETLRNQGQ